MSTLITEKEKLVSYYQPPIRSRITIPIDNLTLKEVSILIKGEEYKDVTRKGRETQNLQVIKETKLYYVTFAGTFSKRSNDALLVESGYYCFDLDHLSDVERERKRILDIKDEYFHTNLLFLSPSGEGLKWVVSITPNGHPYSVNYRGLQKHIEEVYNLPEMDNTSDISRACFLCHDPNVYYNEESF